jgi:Arm DNA-binding domain
VLTECLPSAYRVLTECLPSAYRVLTECLPKAIAVPHGRISKRSVDALSCPAGKDRVFLWDDALAGFGVCAFPSGKKVYVAQYRHARCSHRANLGEHGRLTPDEGRGEAKKLLGDVARGLDPVGQRRAARAVPLFREAATEFMRTHIAAKRKPRTLESYETLLRISFPPLGACRSPKSGVPMSRRCIPAPGAPAPRTVR